MKKYEKVPNYDNNVICDMHYKRDDFKRKSGCLLSSAYASSYIRNNLPQFSVRYEKKRKYSYVCALD
jgi:hypothetical protein